MSRVSAPLLGPVCSSFYFVYPVHVAILLKHPRSKLRPIVSHQNSREPIPAEYGIQGIYHCLCHSFLQWYGIWLPTSNINVCQ